MLTVTGMRPPDVTVKDPSPLAVTYRTSISSRASSRAAGEVASLLSLFLPSIVRRSRAAKSSIWVWSWLSMITPILSDDFEGGM